MKKGVDYIGVGCGCLIVNDQHQVLLIKRTDKSQWGGGGFWSQPGGAIEFGEHIEDAIKREIKEELNIDIELFGPKIYAEDITTKDGTTKHRFTWARFAKIIWWKLTVMEPEKHEAAEWFDLDTLPTNITPYTLPYIQAYKEWLKQ